MKAIVLAALAGLCWGVGEVFTRSVLHSGRIGPMTAIAVRSTVALPLIWLAWWIATGRLQLESRGWMTAATRGDVLKLVLGSGLIAGAAGMICFYLALHLGPVSKIKPVAFSIAPAVAVLLGWLVLGEELSVRKLLAVAMILAGVVLLTGK